MHADDTVQLPALKDLSSLAAEHDADRPAFGAGADGRVVTWGEFDERANRAANALGEYVAPGDRVAFLCDCSIEHVTLWAGALKAGAVVSNVHTRATPETVRHCLDELRPRVLVIDEAFSDLVAAQVLGELGTGPETVVTTGEPRAGDEEAMAPFLADRSTTPPTVASSEDDVVAVVWTSGTTGRPTGWCHTNRSLVLKAYKGFSWDRTARVPQLFTPSFAAWYSTTVPTMLGSASQYFIQSWDPEAYLELIEQQRLTTAILVPTMWREILRLDGFEDYDVSSLESIGASGERLDPTTLQRLREEVCDEVTNAYVATEINATTMTDEEMTEDRIESVGKPIRGTQVRIIEPDGRPDEPFQPGEVGEIVVRGEDRTVRAWEDPAATEAAFTDGWWYSGDLGYVDEEGYLYLEGRKDFMILSKGIKVYPGPVEERLNAHPGVEEAAVVGVDDEEYGERVTAVVQRADPDLTDDDLDAWCLEADDLARYERPRAYHLVDEPLPRTASGKLDRRGAKSDLVLG